MFVQAHACNCGEGLTGQTRQQGVLHLLDHLINAMGVAQYASSELLNWKRFYLYSVGIVIINGTFAIE